MFKSIRLLLLCMSDDEYLAAIEETVSAYETELAEHGIAVESVSPSVTNTYDGFDGGVTDRRATVDVQLSDAAHEDVATEVRLVFDGEQPGDAYVYNRGEFLGDDAYKNAVNTHIDALQDVFDDLFVPGLR